VVSVVPKEQWPDEKYMEAIIKVQGENFNQMVEGSEM
jgi:hypothetical protein